jgi:cytochrome c biogenesis protein CcmG/thiol:disulfide interchange protein DsbE
MRARPEAPIAEMPPAPASESATAAARARTPRQRVALAFVLVLGALAAAAVLLVALLRPAATAPSQPAAVRAVLIAPAKREPLPPVAAETVLPPPARLDPATLRGDPVFIDVWASWCPSCEEEAPMLARLAREHRGRVRFVGIDTNDSRSAARNFIRRHRLEYPHLFDPKTSLATKLGVYGIPTMFLVDREGRIAARLVGKQPEGKLRRLLALLARGPR